MTIVISIKKALFPQKEIKLHISYSKFKAEISIIQISSWSILQKVVQPTHLKTASQNRHRRHQIYYRTLNMKNHPNFLSQPSEIHRPIKGVRFKFCRRLQAPPQLKQIPYYLKIQKIPSGNPLLSPIPSHTLQLPVSPTPMHLQPSSLVRTS